MSFTEATGRAIVRERSGGRCELAIPNVCFGTPDTVHHRAKKGQGGTWAPSNLITACGSGTTGCHGYVEANPAWAREEGLWLFTGDGEPDQVSAHMRWEMLRGWFRLDDEGMLYFDGGELEQQITYHPAVRDMLSPSRL
jgi:hypothetical protein